MLLNKSRASYQFIYGEHRKSWKWKFWSRGKCELSCYLNEIAHFNLHLKSNVTIKSEYFDKWNKTCSPLLIAFSSLSDVNVTLETGITTTWRFTLRYLIATTSSWCWKEISYNEVTSVSIRNRSTSPWKSNKKPMSPRHRVPTGLEHSAHMH